MSPNYVGRLLEHMRVNQNNPGVFWDRSRILVSRNPCSNLVLKFSRCLTSLLSIRLLSDLFSFTFDSTYVCILKFKAGQLKFMQSLETEFLSVWTGGEGLRHSRYQCNEI